MVIFTKDLDESLLQKIKTFPLITEGETADEVIENSKHIIAAIDSYSNLVMGYIILEPAAGDLPPNIHYLEILKEYQRKGLGKRLLNRMINYLREDGEKRVSVWATNNSKSFFENLGFIGQYAIIINIMSTKRLKLNKKDYILYILNKLEPEKSSKLILNKIAFFVEFAFLQKYNYDLSSVEYAAIDHGPVIDGYDEILKNMEKEKLVKIDGNIVRPLDSPRVEIPEEQRVFMDGIIEKYSKLSGTMLRGLSHQTDSYKITTDNERIMGKKINKKLAMLETFLSEDEKDETISDDELPKINRSELIRYVR